jgi:uncharacterized protein YlaI
MASFGFKGNNKVIEIISTAWTWIGDLKNTTIDTFSCHDCGSNINNDNKKKQNDGTRKERS